MGAIPYHQQSLFIYKITQSKILRFRSIHESTLRTTIPFLPQNIAIVNPSFSGCRGRHPLPPTIPFHLQNHAIDIPSLRREQAPALQRQSCFAYKISQSKILYFRSIRSTTLHKYTVSIKSIFAPAKMHLFSSLFSLLSKNPPELGRIFVLLFNIIRGFHIGA